MTGASLPNAWSADIEDAIFRGVVTRFAPHLPLERATPRRAVATRAELEGFCDNWIWTAGHDSFIVQAATKALDRVFPALDQQYFLARQIGDDGFHAEFVRDYVKRSLGFDPIGQINDIVRQHWAALDDLPYRDTLSFFAWELHYELYILARLMTERRTSQIGDPSIKEFAEDRVTPDEEVHRLRILDWWLAYYGSLDARERETTAQRLIALDDEIQRRLNPYLNSRYVRSAADLGTDIGGKEAVYDNFRREVLARLLDMQPETLGNLTSLGD
jgi:hypothetical protein